MVRRTLAAPPRRGDGYSVERTRRRRGQETDIPSSGLAFRHARQADLSLSHRTGKDPSAFKGVNADAIRRAAQGPAPPPAPGRPSADEMRRKRLARLGGGLATKTRP